VTGRQVITREQWGARYGRGHDVSAKLPWPEVVVHTEAGALRPKDWAELAGNAAAYAALNASLTERQRIQAIERFHAVTRGWDAIGYSFLITFDGTIFEGRGWGRSGAHTEGRNSTAAGFCFLGHGDLQPATAAQWASAEWLIREGIRLGHLRRSPIISGHRDYSTKGKTCPGNLIYPNIGRLRYITQPPHEDDDMTPEQDSRLKRAEDAAEAAKTEANEARKAAVIAVSKIGELEDAVDAAKTEANEARKAAVIAVSKIDQVLQELAGR
jgi:N-acetylmuramoyl-L-alanine amidase